MPLHLQSASHSPACFPTPGSDPASAWSQDASAESDEAEQPEEAPDEQKPPYESPVDFESLWRENSDIYAWLDLPGTKISDPILQRDGEDTYYLKHDAHGQPSSWGSIFTA